MREWEENRINLKVQKLDGKINKSHRQIHTSNKQLNVKRASIH